ncbi:MAG: RNA polymerase sigma factor [Clostridia bacterium]|nr:RNA polymerase sigma factor [Clostridia bacterium]
MKQETVSALLTECMKQIFAYALSRVEHKEDAEDLAGDIIEAVLRGAESIRDDHAFYGYLWATASNLYKKYLRGKSRRITEEPDENLTDNTDMESDIVEEIAKNQQIGALRRELSLLSKEYRECTLAYYFNGLSCFETAKKMGLSLEMVKYYLFKTRKLLKEGIGMERTFGEKSYNPSVFQFSFLYNGKDNDAYQTLFNRKLPGNILLSAYYTPMTIREMAMEMGVATVYLEDEVAMLERYDLLTALPGGKYQTKLVIFTEAYTKELYRTVQPMCEKKIKAILNDILTKFPQIRKLGFTGVDFSDDRLLWVFLWELMMNGHGAYSKTAPKDETKRLYDDTYGVYYGKDYEDTGKYSSICIAGRNYCSDQIVMSFADVGILPKKNCFDWQKAHSQLADHVAGNGAPDFPVFTDAQLEALHKIIAPEIEKMGKFYADLIADATALMKEHAPASVTDQVEPIIRQLALFSYLGLIAVSAVESGALALPAEDETYMPFLYGIHNG